MKYFITGISGTLGQAVTRLLLKDPSSEVIGYSRDEFKQASFPKHPRVTLYLGDIRDKRRLIEATREADLIYHFAALKHVDLLEMNPEESIQTNIIGTQNVLHAQRVHNIRRVILSSTDKGVYPVNVYGMCKGIAERLTLRNPNNIVCRYGNVLASRGSVIGLFVKSLKEENKVYLTDPNMSRFWLPIEEAAEFVMQKKDVLRGGLYIPTMKAAPISLVAEAVAEIMNIHSYYIEQVGSRKGEKVSECLQTSYESNEIFSHSAPQFTREDLGTLLRPIVKGLLA